MFRLLTFLGTSSGTPTPYRNVSSACLSLADGRVWMFDCGEGTQHQLLRCKEVSVSKIEKVFLTHLHGDHCYGLPGMLCSMSLMWTAPGVVPNATYAVKKANLIEENKRQKAGDTAPVVTSPVVDSEVKGEDETFIFDHFSKTSQFLEIYGPYGTAAFLREVLRSSETRFGYKYRVTEMLFSDEGCADDSAATNDNKDDTSHSADHCVVSQPVEVKNVAFLECEAPTLQLRIPKHVLDASAASTEEDKKAKKTVLLYDGYSFYLPASAIDPVGGVSVRAAWLDHPVASLGYVLTEADQPGALDVKKATIELKVPKGPLLAKLKSGQSVTFPLADGSEVTVNPDQVIGPTIRGRKLTVLGDTSNSDRLAQQVLADTSSSSSFVGIAENSDWITHESTFDDANSTLALPRGHSTARMAGAFARKIKAKNLIITHFSARYPPIEKDPQPIEDLRRQAVEGFEGKQQQQQEEGDKQQANATTTTTTGDNVDTSRDANVFAAHDFLSIDLTRAAGGALKRYEQK